MEDITDEIHEWFVVWYDAVGHYDVFPATDLGGSVLIVTGQTLTPQEYLIEKYLMEKKKEQGVKEKDRRTKKITPILQVERKSEVPWKTDALSCLEKTNIDFIRNWSFRNENDPEQEYLDLITEKLCYELQLEMRKIVDELMRVELELLNTALLKDQARDKKEFTIPTMRKSNR